MFFDKIVPLGMYFPREKPVIIFKGTLFISYTSLHPVRKKSGFVQKNTWEQFIPL